MYELFMTAVVSDADVQTARSILQGFCSMPETHRVSRILHYRGPDYPAGFKKIPVDRSPNSKLWSTLNQYLTKQSYVMQLRYQVDQSDLGQDSQDGPMNLNQRKGTLHWADIPDPLGPHAHHMQQNTLDIRGQEQLISILHQNAHTFKSECVEESYTWFYGIVEYSLVRLYGFRDSNASGASQSPRDYLPSLSEMRPLSPYWLLRARVFVPEGIPERMSQGAAALVGARRDLHGVFDFKQWDRRVHDTRLMGRPTNNMPIPLPQVVTIGQP